MRISDWSSDVCSSDLPPLDSMRRAGRGYASGDFVRLGFGAAMLVIGPGQERFPPAVAHQRSTEPVTGGIVGIVDAFPLPCTKPLHLSSDLMQIAVEPILRPDRILLGTTFPGRHHGVDRKSVVEGRRVAVRVDTCGRRLINKKRQPK